MTSRPFGRGDVVWASRDPAVGHEQAKHRPWLVLSDAVLHRSRRLFIGVPLTHTNRGWATHVVMDPAAARPSVAVCEQVQSMSVDRVTRVDQSPYDDAGIDQVHRIVTLLTSARP